jgi:F0F1-type ATP synthase membrane subunit b/b'
MVFLILSIISTSVWAGSGSGVSSLIAPAVNLFLLIAFLIYKTKKPLSEYFSNEAQTIAQTLDRANLKAKEAQVLLENQERKLSNISNEIKEINSKTEQDLKVFENAYQVEINGKISKLKSDAIYKMDSDKKQIANELNTKIINQIISRTKNKIAGSDEIRKKATTSVMKGLN